MLSCQLPNERLMKGGQLQVGSVQRRRLRPLWRWLRLRLRCLLRLCCLLLLLLLMHTLLCCWLLQSSV
jgi:hypothetical protein